MADLSDLERKEWKGRLEFADREWQRQGLADVYGQGTGGGTARERDIRTFLEAYRGRHPNVLEGGVQQSDQFVGNLLFSTTNVMVALLSGRTAIPIVRPKGRTLAEPDAHRRAALGKVILEAQFRERKYKREMDRALLCALLTPFGLVRHGYTPEIEEYVDEKGVVFERFKNHEPDTPWVQFMRPWDVRIDSLGNSFDPDGEPRWVAFRNVYTERQVKKSTSLKKRKDWMPTFSPDREEAQPTTRRTEESEEAVKMYEAWHVYDADERKTFAIAPGVDKTVMEPRDWPIDWGQLPYTIITMNEQIDTPFGVAPPAIYWDEQKLYNKVWTILNTIVSRMRKVNIYNKTAFEGDAESHLTNPESLQEYIGITSGNPAEAVRELQMGVIDPQLLGIIGLLKESLRETLGVSNYDRAQRINVETAAEANRVGEGSDINRSRAQANLEDAWEEVARLSHRALLQTQDERKFRIPIRELGPPELITNPEEINRGFVEAGLEGLSGEFDYSVKVGSTLALDPDAELRKKLLVYAGVGGQENSVLDQHYVITDIVREAGQDEQRWVTPREAQAAIADQLEQRGGITKGGAGQGGSSPVELLNATRNR